MANTVAGIHLTGIHASRPAGNAVPDGTLYSCTTHSLVYQSNYAGNSWATWANLSGTGFANPMANKGEMIVGDTAGAASALTAGTAGYALIAAGAGNFPAWTGLASFSTTITAGSYTTTSASWADVDGTNLKPTLTTGARRVAISLVASAKHSTATFAVKLDVTIGGTRLGGTNGILYYQAPGNNYQTNASFCYITEPLTAASHQFALQFSTDGATLTLFATAGDPLRFVIQELLS